MTRLTDFVSLYYSQSLPKLIKSEPGGRKEIKTENSIHGGGGGGGQQQQQQPPPQPTQSPHRPGPYGGRYGFKTELELMTMQREEDIRR